MFPDRLLTRDTWIAVIGSVTGIGAVEFDQNWIVRIVFLAIALGLILYAGFQHRIVFRVLSIILSVIFIALSWRPIWNDFHTAYPFLVIRAPFAYETPSKASLPPMSQATPDKSNVQPGAMSPAAPCPSGDFTNVRIEGFNKGIVTNGCINTEYNNVEIKSKNGSVGIESDLNSKTNDTKHH
jgi:hypothetical protein